MISEKLKDKNSKLSKEEKAELRLKERAEKNRLLLKKEKSKSRKILFKKIILSVIMLILIASMCLPYVANLL